MLEKLDFLFEKYNQLSKEISDPDIIADQIKWKKLVKEHSHLEPIVEKYKEYKRVVDEISDAKELLQDKLEKEFKEMVETELADLQGKKEELEEELKILLLPKDPNDEKNVIVEIRGGAGGNEAALFAGDLLRMYTCLLYTSIFLMIEHWDRYYNRLDVNSKKTRMIRTSRPKLK